ncbi:MAG TPA: 3'-5' exonuclease [Aquifex aeolicus]|nr:3'-5' exonuclease [Aquifex aeolicus]
MNPLLYIKERMLTWKYSRVEAFREFFSPVNPKMPIEEVSFIVFDTETTGLDPRKDELISIGALKVERFQIRLSSAFHRFIRPSDLKRSSVEVHGITPEDLAERGEDEREVISSFLEYVKGSVLVGFNVEFDRKMVSKYTLRHFGIPLLNYRVDVFFLGKRRWREGKGLKDMAKELGIYAGGIHSALDDAYITALLFLSFVARMKKEPLASLPLVL